MIQSRHIIMACLLGMLFVGTVFVAMFGSAALVGRLTALDTERLARSLVSSLHSEFDLPGDPIPQTFTFVDRVVSPLFANEYTQVDNLDIFNTRNFEADAHFGTVRGYAIFTRFGDLMIAGGTPNVRSLEQDESMRFAVENAIAGSTTEIIPLSSAQTDGQMVLSVIIPLRRNGVSRGAISVEIDRHGFEIVLEKGVQLTAFFAAISTGAMGFVGIVFLYTWGRTAQHAQREVVFLAYSDPVTHLPNRRRFEEDLKAALSENRTQGEIAVAFSNVDNFRIVNDIYGHATGDKLLKEVGTRLQQTLRDGDKLYRMSGDSFAMILQINDGEAEVSSTAAQIQSAMEPLLLPDDVGISMSISSGFSLASSDGHDAAELMKKADLALHRAETDGRSTFRIYTPDMGADNQDKLRLKSALERALANDALHLEFQPQIEAASGKLIGFEALARWDHPTEGAIPPQRFIAVAENSGLISKLGEWALSKACEEARDWPEDISIAVNLSPAQLRDPRLIGYVKSVLKKTGISPRRLELEVTESVMMQDTDLTQDALKSMRDVGVGLAMDDFGTGYSSMSYLTRLPLTKLKIDKSFIDGYGIDERDSAVVDSLIQLANRLGLSTTAEGVETPLQADRLKLAGCTSLQGYYFGKPQRDPKLFISNYAVGKISAKVS